MESVLNRNESVGVTGVKQISPFWTDTVCGINRSSIGWNFFLFTLMKTYNNLEGLLFLG
jgi:hypothetical protein